MAEDLVEQIEELVDEVAEAATEMLGEYRLAQSEGREIKISVAGVFYTLGELVDGIANPAQFTGNLIQAALPQRE